MKCKETMKKAILGMGVVMAKVDARTSCPWINYQPCEPAAVVKIRQDNKNRKSNCQQLCGN